MILEIILGLVSVCLLLWWILTPPGKLRSLGEKIPGPKAYPLIGNAMNFHIIGPKAFNELLNAKRQYGTIFRVWLGPQLHVFLSDPSDIQMLLSSTSLITKSFSYNVLHEWLGTGLLVSTGDLWRRRRKAITPTFHFKVLDDFVPIFNKCADTLTDLLKDKADKEEFSITPYFSNCALDTVAHSAMGVEVKPQTKPHSAYASSILQMTKILSTKINYPWLGIDPLYTLMGQRSEEKKNLEILRHLPKKILKEKRAELQSKVQEATVDDFGIKKRYGFLELLLDMSKENNTAFQSDQDIMDEVTTFMFEGHDTTTSALSFAVWLLGKHPDIQEKVYDEVASVSENKEDIKMEDLQQMKYLERVIKESLRLYPSVPIIGRKVDKETVLPSGYTLPAGAEVYATILMMQRDPLYFSEPLSFNPDRFLNDLKHPYCYIPFSAGPRNCIGQKFAMTDLKVIIAKVVLKYKIHSQGELHLDQEMVLRAFNGPKITLALR